MKNVNIYHISLNHPKLHVLGRGSEGEVCSSVPPTTALHGQGALVSTQASGLLPSSLSSQMRTRPQDWDLELSLLSAREGRQDEWEKTASADANLPDKHSAFSHWEVVFPSSVFLVKENFKLPLILFWGNKEKIEHRRF